VAQEDAVAFDNREYAAAASEQDPQGRESRHTHSEGSQLDLAVEPAFQVRNHLRADIRLETIGEDIASDRQRNEHRHRDSSDADEPRSTSSCQLM